MSELTFIEHNERSYIDPTKCEGCVMDELVVSLKLLICGRPLPDVRKSIEK